MQASTSSTAQIPEFRATKSGAVTENCNHIAVKLLKKKKKKQLSSRCKK